MGRLSFFNPNTKELRGKCQLYPNAQESIEHFLWECALAQKIWHQLLQKWTGIKTPRCQLIYYQGKYISARTTNGASTE
jgi:hypothetical protein